MTNGLTSAVLISAKRAVMADRTVPAVVSVFAYLQNFGPIVNLPDFDLPPHLRPIFQSDSKVLDFFCSQIP
jgi:hypothetical protein